MWNNSMNPPTDSFIHEMFEEHVERTPDAVAILFEDQTLTYRELNSGANRLAHYLLKRGVRPGILVAVCVDRSVEAIISLLAIFKSGGVYVPIDPAYPRERLIFMLKDSKAEVIVTQGHLLEIIPAHVSTIVCLDREREAIANEGVENPSPDLSADHFAYAIYTSGSTGTPNGVLISHQSIAGHCLQMAKIWDLTPDDRVHQFSSLSFDGSLEQIIIPLLSGAAVVLRDNNAWTPVGFSEQIMHFGLTVLCLPPAVLHEWAHFLNEFPSHAPACTPRMIICGGEELRPGTIEILKRTSMRCVRLLNVYGPTEATITSTMFEVDLESQEDLFPNRIPIGRPVLNRAVYILDRYGNALPDGVQGEIHIGGDYLACGYLNRPELTAEKFIPDPFSEKPVARLYKTGDLGRYLPDGNIEFLGRIDHQVKIRGFRIELGEIEAALGQHPIVREAIVIAREDQPGEKRIVAYVVLNEKSTISTNKLRNFLKEKLPDYMIPSAFVIMDSLPLTPNGKVDRRALPIPESGETDRDESFVSPRTPIEEMLAGIWGDVLGLKEIGIHDNFFELGGHSLLATQVMSRLRKAFQVEIPLRSLFENPTIAGLAIRIAQGKADDTDPEEMDRLFAELEGSASETVSESGEIGDKRYE